MTSRVLVVDDAIASRETIRTMLEGAGMEIAGEASNGQEALEQYARLRPDVVTMDLVMPELNGVEAARKILALDPRARVIAVTGLGQSSIMAEAKSAGMRGFVTKPLDAKKLLSEIARAVKV